MHLCLATRCRRWIHTIRPHGTHKNAMSRSLGPFVGLPATLAAAVGPSPRCMIHVALPQQHVRRGAPRRSTVACHASRGVTPGEWMERDIEANRVVGSTSLSMHAVRVFSAQATEQQAEQLELTEENVEKVLDEVSCELLS